LLSATWFGSKERALATAVAINFNQVAKMTKLKLELLVSVLGVSVRV
jgi:hypothetical protein